MLRITLPREPSARRTLTEDEFIEEIEGLQVGGFADAPLGPVTVEALDAEGRVAWRAYYGSFARLGQLARELLAERSLVSRR